MYVKKALILEASEISTVLGGKNKWEESSFQLSSGNTAQTPVVSGNVVGWSGSGNIYMTKY
jgi:hypothetical protein